MLEIKRHFRAGKMNKDLDERLVPNGEYRDALNVEVATSDGDDVGALQTVLGNNRENVTNYDGAGIYDTIAARMGSAWTTSGKCIGYCLDSRNDKAYYFVADTNYGGIFEFHQQNPEISSTQSGIIKPILIDKQNVLGFSTSNRITGINAFDGMLFWTDGLNEPKKINIDKFKEYTNGSATTHTQIDGANFAEHHVTLIKKNPTLAPNLEMSSTKRALPIEGEILQNFVDQTTNAPMQSGDTLSNLIFAGDPNWFVGDVIIAKYIDDEGDEFEVRFTVFDTETYSTSTTFDIVIDSVHEDTPNANVLWECILERDKALFEFKFPRFSYRYKYEDGEYSCFAPWSEVAFLGGDEFDYQPNKGYNLAMVNQLRSLKIVNFTKNSSGTSTLPWNIAEIDILYKESNATNVYTVKTLRKVGPGNVPDPEWSADSLEIVTDLIHQTLPTNQLIRPYDNIPKKARAQEFTANRLMFGNYTENFNMTDYNGEEITPNFSLSIAGITPPDGIEVGVPYKSIKSLRTYQLGVVYRDVYGRETPVFTGDTIADNASGSDNIVSGSSISVPKTKAINHNRLSVKLTNNPPAFANSYKFYIKETSSEYYNLCMDRFYDAEDGNAWISFPSADRNKVDEETYLILKKQHDNDNFVKSEARYKIIAIENEAPEYIKRKRQIKGTVRSGVVTFDKRGFRGRSKGDDDTFTTSDVFISGSATPQSNRNYCDIPKPLWDKAGLSNEAQELKSLSNMLMRVRTASKKSNWYDIKGMTLYNENSNDKFNFWRIEIKNRFESDTDWALDAAGNQASGMMVEFAQREIKSSPEFQGRFFVKIYKDEALRSNILTGLRAEDQWDVTYAPLRTFRSFSSHPPNSDTWGGTSSKWYVDSCKYHASTKPCSYCCHAKYVNWSDGDDATASDETGTMRYDGYPKDSGANCGCKRGNITNPGRGAVAGSHYLAIAYNKWGADVIRDNDDAWDKVFDKFETVHHQEFSEFVKRMCTVGSIFKMSEDTGNNGDPHEYEVLGFSRWHMTAWSAPGCANSRAKHDSTRIIRFTMKLNKPLEASTVSAISNQSNDMVFIEKYFVDDETGDFTSENPAIWETEPKENIELDIYHEASNAFDITNPGTATAAHSTTTHDLDWYNCFSFNNGVESNRIRDDFNAVTIDKGPRVSAVFAEQYKEQDRPTDIIYSGIFNSKNSVNRTNQFIQGESITKSLSPRYGSIQKLHARNTDLIALCEDKVLNLPCNKDILYSADGNVNVTASNKVLGTPNPYAGEYGISKDPASFASYGYMAYFTDKHRGTVIRMERNGLVPIANYGMTDYFKDKMRNATDIVGSFDDNRDLYNLTIKTDETSGGCMGNTSNNVTISFSELTKGWTSFKSFIQESGFSINNKYYTMSEGDLWLHHNNQTRNNFYNDQYQSEFVVLLNEAPSVVKSFNTLNYEGSQSRISQYTDTLNPDGINQDVYYNNQPKTGWYCDYIRTDQTLEGQDGKVMEFLDKENKWFNYIHGLETTLNNLDPNEFSVQGIGQATVEEGGSSGTNYTLTITQQQI